MEKRSLKETRCGKKEETVLCVDRILDTARLCSQSLRFPFVTETLAASGHTAYRSPTNGPLRSCLVDAGLSVDGLKSIKLMA